MLERLGRRQFLKFTTAFLVAPYLERLPLNFQQSPNEITPETVEKRFGVRLGTERDYALATNKPLPSLLINYEWGSYDLQILNDTLANLPSHFVHQNDQTLEFILLTSRIDGLGECDCNPPIIEGAMTLEMYQPRILINFRQNNRPRDFETIVHELGHYITPFSDPPLVGDVHASEALHWQIFDEVEQILGDSFESFRQKLLPRVIPQYNDHLQKVYKFAPYITAEVVTDLNVFKDMEPQDLDNFYFYKDFKYALEFINPNDFIPVLCQKYTFGKDYFIKRFSEFLSPEVQEALYNFIGERFFQGKEYNTFPIIQ